MLPTSGAHTTISGLTPLSTVGFRVAVTLNGQPQGEWTQVFYVVVE
jgi:hypothetical protein